MAQSWQALELARRFRSAQRCEYAHDNEREWREFDCTNCPDYWVQQDAAEISVRLVSALFARCLGYGPEEQMADLSGRVLGDYVLREKLGNGGYGEVYRAEHLELRRVAVIKVMNEARRWKDDTAAARFRREAQFASQLRHPNAAHVYDFGVAVIEGGDDDDDDEVMWIAMEFVDGCSFASFLELHGPMSLGEAVQFFEPLLKAVDAAHQCGIVHRDLKPSNVMVVESEGVPVPKLIDFGIAKGTVASIAEDESVEHSGDKVTTGLIRATRSPLYHRTETITNLPPLVPEHRREITPTGAGFGSRAYMSPEQWGDAAHVGRAADIYSLGVMLCEALTGRLPLKAEDTDGYLQAHLHALPDIYVPADLERVLYRALAKKPEQRHANALELAAELREVLQRDPNEQIRSLAQRWHERGRSSDLLARGATLMELKRSVQSVRVASKLNKLDDSFIAQSLQRARRAKWVIVALVALVAMGGLLVRAEKGRRMAEQFATESAVERGQQAVLHGELSEAVRHLGQAYERGERSSEVVFMLARALQPRVSELARFTSTGRMWSAVFSPDGKRVLTADDQGARMWDAASNQLLLSVNHGSGTVRQAEFSPDGSRIVTAGSGVRIWDASTGEPVRELRAGEKHWLYRTLAVSSGLVAAIDVTGGTVHVWDAEAGTLRAELRTDAPEMALLAFSADGHWIATSGRDEVRVFDTSTWKRVATIPGPRVRSLSFDPTGPRLAVGTYDGIASIWEIPSGARLRCLRNGGASVDAVAFSFDGVLIAAASRDGMEQVWEAASGRLRSAFNQHHDKIYAIEFSRGHDLIVSAGGDDAVVISNVLTGMPVARLEGPKARIVTAHFDAEGRRVIGASWDGTARVWDATAPYRRWSTAEIGPDCDTAESLVPDQRFVALSCRDHGTHVWDTASGEVLAKLPSVTTPEGNDSSPFPAVTATGDRAAIPRGNTVEVYALPSGYLLRTVSHAAAVTAVAFATGSHELVSGAVDGSLLVTRDESEPVALPRSPGGIDAISVLADGRVVVADASKRLRVIGADRSALLMDLAAPFRIRLLRSSRDGGRLVTISAATEQVPPVLWDLDRYRPVGPLQGHVGRVFTARFADVDEGTEILTTGSDGTARTWAAATGRPRQTFRGDSHFLADATLSPDGSMTVAGGSDGVLRFWSRSTGRLLWMLRAHASYVVGVHYEGNDLVTRGFAGDIARWALPSPDSVIDTCRASSCAGTDPGKWLGEPERAIIRQ
ncbi:MAG: protein kinase [Kofleriaceae bacterium]